MTTILIKKRDTAGAPTAGDLTNAAGGVEIAVNTSTKRVYSKDSGGNIIELGTNPTSITTGAVSATQVNITGQGDLRLEDTTGGEYVALQAPTSLASSYTLTLPVDDGTNGQALITDGSGNLSWSTAASGDVYGPASATDNAVARFDLTTGKLIQNSVVTIGDTGDVAGVGAISMSGAITLSGGTANGVAYLNGSKVLTTGSALTFDGTNNLTVPKEVYQTTATDYIRIAGGNAAATGANIIVFGQNHAAAPGRLALNAVGTGDITYGAIGAHIWSIGSEQMRLTSTGLGIGTSSPFGKLAVEQNGGNLITARYNSANPRGGIYVANGSGQTFVGGNLTYSSGNVFNYDTTGVAWWIGTPIAQNYLAIGVNSGTAGTSAGTDVTTYDALIIKPSGNVGIGVSPSAWVSGNKALQIGAYAGIEDNSGGGGGIALLGNAYEYSSGAYKYLNNYYATLYRSYAGQHQWYTAPSGTAGNAITFTQAMTLDASGNLLIGTTSGTKLTLGSGTFTIKNATGDSNGMLLYQDTGDTSRIYNYYNGPLAFGTNNTERMRIDSSGNVGIGATPNTGFVNRELTLSSGSGQYCGMTIQNTTTGTSGGFAAYISNTTSYLYNRSNDAMLFGTNNTERMRIDASGNVGIGTSSPAAAYRMSLTGNGSSIVGGLACTSNGNTTYVGQVGATVADFEVWNAANGYFRVGTNNAERMRIDSSGNLLVGTTGNYYTSNARASIVQSVSTGTPAALSVATAFAGDVGSAALYIGKYDNNSTTSQIFAKFIINNTNTGCGQINANGVGAAAFGSWSDERLKENIIDLPSQLNNICSLHPVEFDYIESEGGGHQIGFIAQEMQEIYPDAVGERNDGMLTISGWSKTEARLVKAIQELKAELDATKAEVAALRKGA